REGGEVERGKVAKLYGFSGLKRVEIPDAGPGELVSVAGIEQVSIGDTLADPENPVALPRITVDEPTMMMIFRVNDGPLAGREGKYVTSPNLRDRLYRGASPRGPTGTGPAGGGPPSPPAPSGWLVAASSSSRSSSRPCAGKATS